MSLFDLSHFQQARISAIAQNFNQEAPTDLLEKGKASQPIGTIKEMGGRNYIKTIQGWKYHGKGTGSKAQEHAAGAKIAEHFKGTEKIEEKRVVGENKEEKGENTSMLKFRQILKDSPYNFNIDDLNIFKYKTISGNQESPNGKVSGLYTYQQYKDFYDKISKYYKKNGGVNKALAIAPQKTLSYQSLIPLQQTIRPEKVQSKLDGKDNNKTLPVVFKIDGKYILEGGTHRTVADILRGNKQGVFSYIDLD